ncbi:hypothetical protein E4K10_48355 [Streptomyces sp. T1317-0309]|nr:hypothetical protein E4K10_48355 [Streptomyces sp. T1317-0309]
MTIGLLGVSESGYYAWRERTPSARSLRQAWLSRIIRDIHRSSGAVFGYRRIGRNSVTATASTSAIRRGTPDGPGGLRAVPDASATTAPGRPAGRPPVRAAGRPVGWGRRWIIDVDSPDHPHAVWWAAIVLDTTTHRLIAFSTGRRPTATSSSRHWTSDHPGSRHTPRPDTAGELAGCSFTARAHALRRAPGSGTVGDWYEHSLTEAFWHTLRRELAHHARPEADHHGQALLDTLERLTRQL